MQRISVGTTEIFSEFLSQVQSLHKMREESLRKLLPLEEAQLSQGRVGESKAPARRNPLPVVRVASCSQVFADAALGIFASHGFSPE
jgi:hypothetical protein